MVDAWWLAASISTPSETLVGKQVEANSQSVTERSTGKVLRQPDQVNKIEPWPGGPTDYCHLSLTLHTG